MAIPRKGFRKDTRSDLERWVDSERRLGHPRERPNYPPKPTVILPRYEFFKSPGVYPAKRKNK